MDYEVMKKRKKNIGVRFITLGSGFKLRPQRLNEFVRKLIRLLDHFHIRGLTKSEDCSQALDGLVILVIRKYRILARTILSPSALNTLV